MKGLEEDYSPSPEYQKLFTGEFNKVADRLDKQTHGILVLKPDNDLDLGQYVLNGTASVVQEGKSKLGVVTTQTDISVDLHIAPGELKEYGQRWIVYRSILAPAILYDDNRVDTEIIKYILMLNSIVRGGGFGMLKGTKDLIWKTVSTYEQLIKHPKTITEQLGKEIDRHAVTRFAYAPHIDLTRVMLKSGRTAHDLFQQTFNNDTAAK